MRLARASIYPCHFMRGWPAPSAAGFGAGWGLYDSSTLHERKMSCCARTADNADDDKTVHILLGVFFCLNFILSTGYLGMPFAFYHAGLLLSAFMLSLVLFVGWNCSVWELETMARAQVINTPLQLKL